jgi:DNA-binding transcriptional MerR regulator
MKIGDLARRAGTTTKTVRHYERLGLLRPSARGDNLYRYYDEAHVQQLRFIRRAQRLGLTLGEIGQLMELAGHARCNELRSALDDLFDRKIREYELKVSALRTLQSELRPEEGDCACRSFVPDCECLPTIPV